MKENNSTFLECLTKALFQYTNLDLETPEGRQLLMTHFFNQCYSDIRAKLRHLEKGPLTLQTKVLEAAFKVCLVSNDKARNHCHVVSMATRAAKVTDHLTGRGDRPPNLCCSCCSPATRCMFQMW